MDGPATDGPTSAGTGEEEDGAYTQEDPNKGGAAGGAGSPAAPGDGEPEGEPQGDESAMEGDVKGQPPRTEGTADETKKQGDDGASADVQKVADEQGPDAAPDKAPVNDRGVDPTAVADAAPDAPQVDVPGPQPVSAPGGKGPGPAPSGRGGGGGGMMGGDISLEANGIDPKTLPPEAVAMVMDVLAEMKAEDTAMAESFFAARASDSAGLAAMSGDIEGQISAGVADATSQVQSAADAQKAAVSAGVAAAKSQVQSAADQARAAVESQLASALAAIDTATETGKSTIEADKAAALTQVASAEQAQRANIEQMYAQADQLYKAAGTKVGQEAITRGESRASEYLSHKINRDDSWLDGPVTDNKCEARANAAREVAKAYQTGLQDEAVKQAAAAMQNKSKDLELVASTAEAARTQLEQHYTSMIQQLEQSAQASRDNANQSAEGLRTAVDSALNSGMESLTSHESAQLAALDSASSQACSNIQAAGQASIQSLSGGLSTAVADLDGALQQVRDALADPKIPSPEAFSEGLAEADAQFQQNIGAARDAIGTGIEGAVSSLNEQAAAAVASLTSTGESAVQVANETATQIASQLAQLQQTAQTTFSQLQTQHQQGVQASVESAKAGYTQIVEGLQTSYQQVSEQLTQGMQANVQQLETGLRGALTEMDAKISEEAEKAADKVQPRWKSVLKWVCIIAVIVVVALVLGPLVVGAVGGVLGSGLLATVVGGAIVGAISSAATTLISNAFDGNPLTQGLGTAILMGAITGGIGAGLGSIATNVASKGGQIALSGLKEFAINVSVDVVVDTATNLLTGQLTWESFAQGLITSVIMNGATTHPRIKGITEHFSDVGKNWGTNLRTNISGPTVTPTTDVTAPKVDEPTVKVDEPSVKVDETTTRVDETTTRVDETTSRVDEPTTKVDEPAAKVDEPTAKVEEPTTKVEEPTTKVEEPTTKVEESTVKTEEPTTKVEEPAPKVEEPTTKVEEPAPKVEEPTTKVDETTTKVDETTAKTEEVAPVRREPPPELQSKGNELIAKANEMAQNATDPKVKQGHEDAAKKLQQILDEQSPGVTDQLKMQFMEELEIRLNDPANAGKDLFTMIRDTVNAASVKDANGRVIENKYLKQGDTISSEALGDAGNMSRLYGTDKVFDMLLPNVKADLTAAGVTKESFGNFLHENPGFDLHGSLDPKATVEGYNDTAWWGLQSEGKAGNVTELIDALALNPEYYPQGGVRFNISPDVAGSAGMKKPTAFDGMFPEWVPTDVTNDFGVTGGGKQEGVAGRIEVDQVTNIEVFAGTPEQLVTNRSDSLNKLLTGQGNADGAALVNKISTSTVSADVRSNVLKDLDAAVRNPANTGKSTQELLAEIITSNPKYAGLSDLAPPTTRTVVTDETPVDTGDGNGGKGNNGGKDGGDGGDGGGGGGGDKGVTPEGGKQKTKGTPEAQLTDKGLKEPVPLTKSEQAAVEGWQSERNRYLKKWRETDLDGVSDDVAKLLGGKGADNAIRKSMTPDDAAAVVKERRGVKILDAEGNPYDHVKEATDAMASVRNRIIEIQERLDAASNGKSTLTDRELGLLQDKLGDLSRLLDHYESVIK